MATRMHCQRTVKSVAALPERRFLEESRSAPRLICRVRRTDKDADPETVRNRWTHNRSRPSRRSGFKAWNQRDVEAILSDYAEDVLAAFPGNPELELLGVCRGVDSLVVHFQSKGRRAAEVMELNQSGKICRAMAHGQI